jgi:UDP-N-acetylmuramate dehydrogenase
MKELSANMEVEKKKFLSEKCTFGIGGPALYYIQVKNQDQAQQALAFAKEKELPYLVLGKGSNCLFDDRGFKGLVIHNKIDFFEQPIPGTYHAGAGYSFSLLGVQTARQGWSGLEFASGIPGTVGGAVYMNAGANGSETKDCLQSVDFLDAQGNFHLLMKDDLHFSYRSSSFHHRLGIITGATFNLQPSPLARSKQLEIIAYRKKTQPYKDKSAGCIFRNPSCNYAGALIEQSSLKGKQIGGAKVSDKHANFIINASQATSEDVLTLISLIKSQIKQTTGIELESEVRCIPYDPEQT